MTSHIIFIVSLESSYSFATDEIVQRILVYAVFTPTQKQNSDETVITYEPYIIKSCLMPCSKADKTKLNDNHATYAKRPALIKIVLLR